MRAVNVFWVVVWKDVGSLYFSATRERARASARVARALGFKVAVRRIEGAKR